MKWIIRLREVVFHEAEIEAQTYDEARALTQQLIENDQLDSHEVDSTELRVVSATFFPQE